MSSSSDHSDDNPLWGLLLPACVATPILIVALCCWISKKIHNRRVQNSLIFGIHPGEGAGGEIEMPGISSPIPMNDRINIYPTMAHGV